MSLITLICCGSFNPITMMHLRMFELARHYFKQKNITVERGVMSPANDLYAIHKPSLSPARHRIAMINLALNDSPWIVCDDWESRQKDWPRTLIALQQMEKTYGPNIKLLCGADMLDSFLVPNLWDDAHIEEILRRYGLVVVTRANSDPWRFIHESSKASLFEKNRNNVDIVEEWNINELSSTRIRRAVKENQCIDYLTPKRVINYINDNHLYKY